MFIAPGGFLPDDFAASPCICKRILTTGGDQLSEQARRTGYQVKAWTYFLEGL